MIRLYFETVGWPTFLPNAEHKSFAEQILKQKDKAFRHLLKEGQIPLRQGDISTRLARDHVASVQC